MQHKFHQTYGPGYNAGNPSASVCLGPIDKEYDVDTSGAINRLTCGTRALMPSSRRLLRYSTQRLSCSISSDATCVWKHEEKVGINEINERELL